MAKTISALAQIIESEYGGGFKSIESVVDTGAVSVRGVMNDPNAVETVIINTGAEDVYVSPSTPAAVASGLFLHANGGSVTLTVRDDLTLAGHEWYAVSPGGASSLYILRVVRYQAPE